ncbi:unnamed protein product [Caenorhabditis auriculariae]|uniref:Uncharacterized protein n=1 Tax=Caenorhabditis auriculariae TaxID=2777116 RepID=A0A8S1H1I6_9PELO|nr:unnamed protein product [Caenorhabditis auriculariae]
MAECVAVALRLRMLRFQVALDQMHIYCDRVVAALEMAERVAIRCTFIVTTIGIAERVAVALRLDIDCDRIAVAFEMTERVAAEISKSLQVGCTFIPTASQPLRVEAAFEMT